MKKEILDIVENYNSKKPLRKTQIRRQVCKDDSQGKEFTQAMRELILEGKVKKLRGGQYTLGKTEENYPKATQKETTNTVTDSLQKAESIPEKSSKDTFATGMILIKEGGFGFVNSETIDQAIFIPPGFTNNAFDSDIVEVLITDDGDSRGPVGKVSSIITPITDELTGMLKYKGGLPCIKPLRNGYPAIFLHETDLQKYPDFTEGDWIKVKIIERGTSADKVSGKIIEKIGNCGDLKAELDSAIMEFGLQQEYNEDDEVSAGKLRRRPIDRQDLRKEFVATIDPFDAKDFDDALSIHAEDEETVTVGVHIADVAAYISPYGDWQDKIKQRCFTAYLPGRMLPMLPKILVSKRCSLIAGEDKPAHTVMIKVDKVTGKVLSSERFHSLIRVKQRLNYEEVQEFADRDFSHPEWSEELSINIKKLYQLSASMRLYRKKDERFLPIEAPETRVICDSNTFELKGLKTEQGLPSNQLVEEYMLAANEAVARELHQKEIPGIYRTHDAPDGDVLEMFSTQADILFDCPSGNLTQRNALLKFLRRLKDRPEISILSFEFLRTMQRAQYQNQPSLHYGLGKEYYLHFTSPIRRYSDLLVHQQLWELECGRPVRTHEDCEQEASLITHKEYQNDEAYRAISSRFKLHYIKQLQEEQQEPLIYNAVVSKISDKGLKVWLPELGLYNFLALRSFKDDYYVVDKLSRYIQGKRKKKILACGDTFSVKIAAIDFDRKELKLEVDKLPKESRLNLKDLEQKERKAKFQSRDGKKPSKNNSEKYQRDGAPSRKRKRKK